MRSRITIKRHLAAIGLMLSVLAFPVKAGAVAFYTSYPVQDFEISTMEWTLTEYIRDHTQQAASVAASQTVMMPFWRNMDKWKRQYDHYLNEAGYILNTAQATSVVYVQALEVFRELVNVSKAIKANPQGVIASSAISDVTLNTAATVLDAFSTMKAVCAKDSAGKLAAGQIMMDGRARCEMMWNVSTKLQRLRNTLRRLAVTISSYNMIDVWWALTMPYGIYSHKQIADMCFRRWRGNFRNGSPISIF